ncbi:hypothetical protein [Algibacter mikhailovii]|uniref:WD40 repeat domain-containing protein n=1 Tax=Algibacter mikhailovii TaxID=425498 RepID=A0A918VCI6_9FLAO|nr:hypothetical protein [Algibacter mikhailovii]GGZ89228.1 hypothetical protein GCM10007028_29320 [Algibacter mikhailovii]
MRVIGLSLFFLFFNKGLSAQEVVLNTNFAVRDFILFENSLIFIEKRDLKSYNLRTRTKDAIFKEDSCFVGGFGLRLYNLMEQKKIITAANELYADRSSIRFYDLIQKDINKYHVLYSTKLLDFFIHQEDSLFFISKKDSTIESYQYGTNPRYKKIDSIKIDSYARRMGFFNNNLYYITDSGKVIAYDVTTKTSRMIYKGQNRLVNFVFDNKHEYLYVTSVNGEILKINIANGSKEYKLIFGNQIIEAIDIYKDRFIIAGDWSGIIKIIDLNTFEIVKEYYDKARIIKILVSENYFYTSSSNRTIKKWKII